METAPTNLISQENGNNNMPIFMYQLKYTPAAWASFIKKPEERGVFVDELRFRQPVVIPL
jgi:hypothetical protein